eukprot:m.1273198 g.1273198  ORF g.1273198 m.1273198 type:complete len:1045 (+) comp24752_c0_seq5:183-3317(+)
MGCSARIGTLFLVLCFIATLAEYSGINAAKSMGMSAKGKKSAKSMGMGKKSATTVTSPPTRPPTRAPTRPPTRAPTRPPTRTPTNAPPTEGMGMSMSMSMSASSPSSMGKTAKTGMSMGASATSPPSTGTSGMSMGMGMGGDGGGTCASGSGTSGGTAGVTDNLACEACSGQSAPPLQVRFKIRAYEDDTTHPLSNSRGSITCPALQFDPINPERCSMKEVVGDSGDGTLGCPRIFTGPTTEFLNRTVFQLPGDSGPSPFGTIDVGDGSDPEYFFRSDPIDTTCAPFAIRFSCRDSLGTELPTTYVTYDEYNGQIMDADNTDPSHAHILDNTLAIVHNRGSPLPASITCEIEGPRELCFGPTGVPGPVRNGDNGDGTQDREIQLGAPGVRNCGFPGLHDLRHVDLAGDSIHPSRPYFRDPSLCMDSTDPFFLDEPCVGARDPYPTCEIENNLNSDLYPTGFAPYPSHWDYYQQGAFSEFVDLAGDPSIDPALAPSSLADIDYDAAEWVTDPTDITHFGGQGTGICYPVLSDTATGVPFGGFSRTSILAYNRNATTAPLPATYDPYFKQTLTLDLSCGGANSLAQGDRWGMFEIDGFVRSDATTDVQCGTCSGADPSLNKVCVGDNPAVTGTFVAGQTICSLEVPEVSIQRSCANITSDCVICGEDRESGQSKPKLHGLLFAWSPVGSVPGLVLSTANTIIEESTVSVTTDADGKQTIAVAPSDGSNFGANTDFTIAGETRTLHTSCSQPIFVGLTVNFFSGTLTITGFTIDVDGVEQTEQTNCPGFTAEVAESESCMCGPVQTGLKTCFMNGVQGYNINTFGSSTGVPPRCCPHYWETCAVSIFAKTAGLENELDYFGPDSVNIGLQNMGMDLTAGNCDNAPNTCCDESSITVGATETTAIFPSYCYVDTFNDLFPCTLPLLRHRDAALPDPVTTVFCTAADEAALTCSGLAPSLSSTSSLSSSMQAMVVGAITTGVVAVALVAVVIQRRTKLHAASHTRRNEPATTPAHEIVFYDVMGTDQEEPTELEGKTIAFENEGSIALE